MTSLIEVIRRRFARPENISPGVYQFKPSASSERNYRLHLRVEVDGSGVLLVDAATILHLNETATEYAYHMIQETPPEDIATQISSRYNVSKSQAQNDFEEFYDRLQTLITTPDLDPVMYLDFDRHDPYSVTIHAPYRLDCAITYRLPEGDTPHAAPLKRVDRELSTEEWMAVIKKAWDAGVPHIIFTGGEPTLRDDLVQLIACAEDLGQVTGLLTDGIKLSDSSYLDKVLNAGLDHAMFVLEPNSESSWNALENFIHWADSVQADIFIAVHFTITEDTSATISTTIERIAKLNVPAISLSARSNSLQEHLSSAQQLAAESDLTLVWDLPVPYSEINPISFEIEEDQVPSGAGKAWLYVEPDGDVLPAQGINQVIGNLCTDVWGDIWKSD